MRQNCLNFYWLFIFRFSFSTFVLRRVIGGGGQGHRCFYFIFISLLRSSDCTKSVAWFSTFWPYRATHIHIHTCIHTHTNGHPVESFIFHFGQTENTQRERNKKRKLLVSFWWGSTQRWAHFSSAPHPPNPPVPLSLSPSPSASVRLAHMFRLLHRNKKKTWKKGRKKMYDNSWAIVFDMTFYQKQICSSLLCYFFFLMLLLLVVLRFVANRVGQGSKITCTERQQ